MQDRKKKMTKTILKIYFPHKESVDTLLPIEVDIVNSNSFDKSVSNLKENFIMFVAKIFEQNPELEIETDIEKCKFEKIIIEELDINAF